MEHGHEPERINRIKALDSIIDGLMKENRRLSPPKMVRLTKDIPDDELFRHLEIIKLLAGAGYIMKSEHEQIIIGMIYYFNGLEEQAKKAGFDLSKGIGLTGTWGVGKTTIFGVFHDYLEKICPPDYNPNTFRITSTDEIIESLRDKSKREAFKTLFLLNTLDSVDGGSKPNPIHICINEFGARYDIKDYGSDVNDLFDTFMMHRYDIFIKYGKVTHMTTNYGAKDLEKIFSRNDLETPDAKLPDRFREMWNMKNLKGTSFRK